MPLQKPQYSRRTIAGLVLGSPFEGFFKPIRSHNLLLVMSCNHNNTYYTLALGPVNGSSLHTRDIVREIIMTVLGTATEKEVYETSVAVTAFSRAFNVVHHQFQTVSPPDVKRAK